MAMQVVILSTSTGITGESHWWRTERHRCAKRGWMCVFCSLTWHVLWLSCHVKWQEKKAYFCKELSSSLFGHPAVTDLTMNSVNQRFLSSVLSFVRYSLAETDSCTTAMMLSRPRQSTTEWLTKYQGVVLTHISTWLKLLWVRLGEMRVNKYLQSWMNVVKNWSANSTTTMWQTDDDVQKRNASSYFCCVSMSCWIIKT